jgi:hypothetical protein
MLFRRWNEAWEVNGAQPGVGVGNVVERRWERVVFEEWGGRERRPGGSGRWRGRVVPAVVDSGQWVGCGFVEKGGK